MRDTIHKALIGARDVIDGAMTEMSKGNVLSEDEMLHRYTALHRGNARAMATFVKSNAPPGTDMMKAWRSYESTMEQKLAERGGQMAVPGYLKFRGQ